MDIRINIFLNTLCFVLINSFVVKDSNDNSQISESLISEDVPEIKKAESDNPTNVFNGVYTECFFHLSYTCLQKKTLLYLKELNKLNEISVIGDYVKFVKLNTTENFNRADGEEHYLSVAHSSEELAYMIDKAVDKFFDNHLIRFSALGKDIIVPDKVEEEFVGRKKRKGGGGGGGGHGGGDGDGGKKKMMMMAMMCMKMKLMMMIPAMMGMMGMMSFKGMMFSMMSFMISKMMLLMKILEKKGGGAGGGGGGDGGWAAGGGGGGAWMPTGQDYGGGGGGYDANGQWQSRSILEDGKDIHHEELPIISYTKPIVRYSNPIKTLSLLKSGNNQIKLFNNIQENKAKLRKKREINIKDLHSEEKPKVSYEEPIITYDTLIKSLSFIKNAYQLAKKYKNNYENKSNSRKEIELIKDIDKEEEIAIDRHNNLNNPVLFTNKADNHTPEQYNNYLKILDSVKEKPIEKVNSHITEKYNDNYKGNPKSRKKRGILDILKNAYLYWTNKVLGIGIKRPTNNYPKYKVVNGIKYVYYPVRTVKVRAPKELPIQTVVKENEVKSVIVDDFNKGEIIEGPIESRMIRKRIKKVKDNMNETVDMVDDNPWQ